MLPLHHPRSVPTIAVGLHANRADWETGRDSGTVPIAMGSLIKKRRKRMRKKKHKKLLKKTRWQRRQQGK